MESAFGYHSAKETPSCPICSGVLERVYSRFGENVFVCVECHTGMTVPRNAWDIAAVRRQQRQKKPNEKTG
jgi:uncharacterized protein YbbK (DUF523 family)